MTRHQPAFGIVLMVLGCLLLTFNDALSKLLTERLSVSQIIFCKSLFGLLLLIAFSPMIGPRRMYVLHDWKGQALRAVLTVLSSFVFVVGLTYLPLSTSVTVGFVGPLYITALAPLLLGEKVGIHRWSAVLVGFCGVVIVIWPSPEGFSYAALLPLLSAFFGALRDITTRWMSSRSTSESMIFYATLSTTVAGGVATGGDVLTIARWDWFLLAVAAIAATAALYLTVEALRHTEASVIAPFKYSNLLWVTILDVVFWQHFPSWNIFAGAALIIASMLYIYHRERIRHRLVTAELGPDSR